MAFLICCAVSFYSALGEGAFADGHAYRQTDQVGVVEFYTRAIVAIVVEHFDPEACRSV